MNLDIFSSWTYAQAQATEDAVLERARERGRELGVESVGVATGGFLTVLAAISGARNLVEIGTGVGISGTCLLRGAGKHAALTTIDIDVDHLSAAREAFHDAGFDSSRTRAISGRAQTVLPRLTDGAYDLVFIDADKTHLLEYTTQAIRLVRIGGLVVMHDAFDQHRVPKPALRQTSTVATRNANRMLRDDERFVSTIVPTGLGLHLAARVS